MIIWEKDWIWFITLVVKSYSPLLKKNSLLWIATIQLLNIKLNILNYNQKREQKAPFNINLNQELRNTLDT
ncbi:hypothetical protein SAMN06265350_102245 [Solitalea koreensis]|uniref:Uncharacterized protein n=1 Tax=Solitalea koreensis TaxID=543615 RepID=A0A521BJC0_9SPHI|nr:hypothetical protein SAMN06265350_102245 [Solitalea koreensis]